MIKKHREGKNHRIIENIDEFTPKGISFSECDSDPEVPEEDFDQETQSQPQKQPDQPEQNIVQTFEPTHQPSHTKEIQRLIQFSSPNNVSVTLAKRLIYSHHICDSYKRKSLVQVAWKLNLGGWSKIGFPGVVIIEGTPENCDLYIDTIQRMCGQLLQNYYLFQKKRMRWKYFCVRGEENDDVTLGNIQGCRTPQEALDKARKLPRPFRELGSDQMHILAENCKKCGIEELFKTSMKIYKKDQKENAVEEVVKEKKQRSKSKSKVQTKKFYTM